MLKQSIKQSLVVVAGLLILWAPVQTWLLNTIINLELEFTILDVGLTISYLSLAGFVIINILEFYHPKGRQLIMVVGISLLAGFLSVIGVEESIRTISSGSLGYLEDFFSYRIIFSELIMLVILSNAYNATVNKSTKEDEERRTTTEKMARDAELGSLRQQLQPHFLFNSLNSINALIGSQPEKARMMVQQLSDFLRGTIKKDDKQLVPLFEEIQQLKLYLEIEKVRFGHRLLANIESDNASLQAKIPPLLIQPVVENAIKFGLYDTIGETIISIRTNLEDKQLVVRVENPFDATTASPRQGTGFGLSSLQRRLYLLYARNDLLTTTQQANTFITQIRIPQRHD